MKERDLNSLFREISPVLDREEPAEGHELRFLEKLEAQHSRGTGGGSWWRPLSVAASVLILLGVSLASYTGIFSMDNSLAEVAPEFNNTERYFAGVISEQLSVLKQEDTPEAKRIVSDAMEQLDALEADYGHLKSDLLKGGDQGILLKAIVQNFQRRIDLLEEVMQKLETVKKLKIQDNENNTI